jgi:hypothetical protein
MTPSIDLRVEVLDTTVPMGARADLAGPARAKLVVSIKNGGGWMLDVLRNGLVEAMHSSRHISDEEFCAVVDVRVQTSCTFKIACRREDAAILSDPVVLRLLSGVGEIC